MTAPALMSVVLLTNPEQDLPLPDSGPYIVATRDGYMVHQKTHWGRTLTPMSTAPTLQPSNSFLWHHIELPGDLIGMAWSFFRAVFEKRKSEAMVDITWSRDRGYRLFVPPQKATAGGVDAKRNPEHYKGQIVGTIHSHCDFSAYHSGTDHNDAEQQNGLHVTIGHVLNDKLDIAIMVSHGKINWELELSDITKDEVVRVPHPTWWHNFVADPEPYRAPSTPYTSKPTGSIVTMPGTGAPKPSGLIVGESTTKPKPTTRKSYPNLDALVLDLNPYDPYISDLEDSAAWLDQIKQDLDQMGLDFEYEVTPQFTDRDLQSVLERMEGEEKGPYHLT